MHHTGSKFWNDGNYSDKWIRHIVATTNQDRRTRWPHLHRERHLPGISPSMTSLADLRFDFSSQLGVSPTWLSSLWLSHCGACQATLREHWNLYIVLSMRNYSNRSDTCGDDCQNIRDRERKREREREREHVYLNSPRATSLISNLREIEKEIDSWN